MKGLPSCICVHDDHYFLASAIQAVKEAGPVFCYVSRLAWNGSDGDWERAAEEARAAGAEVVVGDWPDESLHRRAALDDMRARGHRYCLIPDGDEILEPALLDALVRIAGADLASRVYVHMDTYWKSPEYVIRPREALTPVILINLQEVQHVHIRDYAGGKSLTLSPQYGVIHHLSYAGPDQRIKRKIESWGHRHEVLPDWYERVWRGWDQNPHMRNIHPTHPAAYGWAERIHVPPILAAIPAPTRDVIETPDPWPSISVVIPLYGGEDDIAACLKSLEPCRDLLAEVIVVDDVSPDGAAEVVAGFEFVTLAKNETNLGFAATCNRGLSEASGDVVIFLNSDTVVPRAGLVRLVESLTSSGSVAAAGPVSSEAGHGQRIDVTYTSLETMPLFAEDLASCGEGDKEVDMLVGFCIAVKSHVLREVGGFDERFGIGQFEDNDLCYRMRRAGYKLHLARNAFVHHHGHKSLNRRKEHPAALLSKNQRVFLDKWKEDLEIGFASHLSGMSAQPIRFNPARRPDLVAKELATAAKKADISLCMIVKNEERVLADCLKSVQGVFSQIIVVDTGSTDRTKEIATEFGAEVHDFPWTDSFSEARNESLRHAKGRWIFWMDADDTLPRRSAEEILKAAIEAKPDTNAYVVPVRFTDSGASGGTQVDHVKLFRNLPGIHFKGHIHEQILPSLRTHGGAIERINAVVLHSGYDTSEEGQARKRERDWKLLKLDLEDEPDHPFYNFNMGMTCHHCGMHEEAVHWLTRSIELAKGQESHVRKAYAMLGVSLRELDRPEEAIQQFLQGLESVGEDAELRFQAAIVQSKLGRWEEAKANYLSIGTDIGGYFSSVDVAILGAKRYHNLANVCEALGELGEAYNWYWKAAKECDFAPSAEHLVKLGLQTGNIRSAREAHQELFRLTGPADTWVDLGCRIAEESGSSAEQFLRETLRTMPYTSTVKVALARLLLNTGREREALPHLYELDRLDCAEAIFYLGVMAVRQGDYALALGYFERAHSLDPSHKETSEQIRLLREQLQQEGADERPKN